MTQEDKKLLLKELSARLPYGVKVWYKYYSENITEKFATSIRLVDGKIALSSKFNREGDWYPVEEANELLIKPYLRPISSMTEEELEEWESYIVPTDIPNSAGLKAAVLVDDLNHAIDWLNAYHFDFRNLIGRRLALEAPDGMYDKIR